MSVDVFVELVRDFVATMDRAELTRPYDTLMRCARLLPRIYAAGLELPEPVYTEDVIGSDVPTPMIRLGRYEVYHDVFDPCFENEAIAGCLSVDLSEIYGDLAAPLQAYDLGRKAEAVWQWKFNIRGHCGCHLVGALRVIHFLVNDHMPDDYDPAKGP